MRKPDANEVNAHVIARTCDVCQTTYTTQRGLDRHLMTDKHLRTYNANRPGRTCKCDDCATCLAELDVNDSPRKASYDELAAATYAPDADDMMDAAWSKLNEEVASAHEDTKSAIAAAWACICTTAPEVCPQHDATTNRRMNEAADVVSLPTPAQAEEMANGTFTQDPLSPVCTCQQDPNGICPIHACYDCDAGLPCETHQDKPTPEDVALLTEPLPAPCGYCGSQEEHHSPCVETEEPFWYVCSSCGAEVSSTNPSLAAIICDKCASDDEEPAQLAPTPTTAPMPDYNLTTSHPGGSYRVHVGTKRVGSVFRTAGETWRAVSRGKAVPGDFTSHQAAIAALLEA